MDDYRQYFYNLETVPLDGPATASLNGTLIAESAAAKVMFETRLPEVIYFPKADILVPSQLVPGKNTFCPFKGTASYWDLKVGDTTLPAAAWSYETPLRESALVADHMAFAPGNGIQLSYPPKQATHPGDPHITGPLLDWLMREASLCETPEQLTEELARQFLRQGIALSRMSVMIWSLHPQIVGKNYIWNKGDSEITVYTPSYRLLDDPAYINSPLKHVTSGLGGVRQPLLGQAREFEFPILNDLVEQGATDYVAMPLQYSSGRINVLSLTCDHPDGFTTSNLGLVFECSPIISRLFEVFTLKHTASTLLDTYLGKRTGARVLGGDIRRGDGEEIDAAVMFCDLRNSSALVERLPRTDYLDLLNAFFEKSSEIISRHDGEILKFIGDAVLAVFPATIDKQTACKAALEAATQMEHEICRIMEPDKKTALRCAIGIDFGNVTYGNVGSNERLDFTVIGAAANIAARLGDLGKSLDRSVLASKSVIEGLSTSFQDMGNHRLHNVSEPVRAFSIES